MPSSSHPPPAAAPPDAPDGDGDRGLGGRSAHPALEPLAREHRRTVALAGRLLAVDATTAPAALEALRAFLDADGLAHFTVEELVLLRALLSADPDARPWADRLLYEHDTIRIRAETLTDGAPATVDALRELGRLMLDNVRGEEEELFPRLAATLDVAGLGPAIAAHLHAVPSPPA